MARVTIRNADGSHVSLANGFTFTTPPAFSVRCPSALSVVAEDDTGALITYPDPVVTGGVPPVTWVGAPASGARFPVGTTTVQVTATDAEGTVVQCSFPVTVLPQNPPPQPLAITTSVLPTGVEGSTYSATIQASGGVQPYTFALIGSVPGLTFSPGGVLSGVPTTSGDYAITIRVTDALSVTTTRDFTVTVVEVGGGTYYETLAGLPQRIGYETLRSQARLNTLCADGGPSTRITYDYAGDAYPLKQDAAKMIIPSTRSDIESFKQIRIPVRRTSGTILTVWDYWWGPEYQKVSNGGNYNSAAISLQHKSFQFAFSSGATGVGNITHEVQTWFSKSTAGNIGTVNMRFYSGTGPNMVNNSGNPYGPGTAPQHSVFLPHTRYIRYVVETRLNQDASAFTEWVALTGPIPAGTYHMVTVWVMTPTTGPTRIVFRVPVYRNTGDGLAMFWHEHDTSSPAGAFTAEVTSYLGPWVQLLGYTLPATPENDTLIFQRPT